MMEQQEKIILPSLEELEQEAERVEQQHAFQSVLRSTFYILITVAAIAVLISVYYMPVLHIYGTSMTPALNNGELVAAIKTTDLKHGDIVAFYYNNKLLVKRVVGVPGDWIDLKENGDFYVNGKLLEEPYIEEKAFGDCNITLPVQVSESRYFLVGDHRSVSIDSRNTAVGFVSEEQIVGKLVFRLWPYASIGKLK